MGLMRLNPLVADLEGTLGGMVLAKHRPGVKITRKKPDRTAPPTAGELANRAKMRCAVLYAKAVWANNSELKAKYNAAARLKFGRGFNLAKADFLKPPTVDDIDLSAYTGKAGEVIRVRARDNFEVLEVKVRIKDLAGNVLEEGAAVADEGQWAYTAAMEVPAGQTVVVEATAADHAGHSASKRVDHACGPRA